MVKKFNKVVYVLLLSIVMNIFTPFILMQDGPVHAQEKMKITDYVDNPKKYPIYHENGFYPVRVYKDRDGVMFFSISYNTEKEILRIRQMKKTGSSYSLVTSRDLKKGQEIIIDKREFGFKDKKENHYWFISRGGSAYNLAIVYNWRTVVMGDKINEDYYHSEQGYGGPSGIRLPEPMTIKVIFEDEFGNIMTDNNGSRLETENYPIFQGQNYEYDGASIPKIKGYVYTSPENLKGLIKDENIEIKIVYFYQAAEHKPETGDLTEGDEKLTGKGIEGDTIKVIDKDGNILGQAEVDKDGNFTVDLKRPLEKDEEIIIRPERGQSKGEDLKKRVNAKPFNPEEHKPDLDSAKEGDKQVTGTGVPGDKIVIEDENGSKLGEGIVGEDGKFEIDLEEELKPGSIIARPETDGQLGSPTDEKEVEYNSDYHKPTIDQAKDGEEVVIGTGIPGDEIIIKDEDGEELGRGQVDLDGNYLVGLDRPLKSDETITATPITGEKEGISTEKKIDYDKEGHKVDIIEAKDGEKKVRVEGVVGDEIVIRDENGKELGRAKVEKDGPFEIELNRPLKEGEKITATPETKVGDEIKEGESSTVTITYDATSHKPTIIEAEDGKELVKGTGRPGDTIEITDEHGQVLGTGLVDKDGNFEVKVKPLRPGKITATPITGNNRGEIDEREIEYNPNAHKPNIDKAKEGEVIVKGTGIPGDEIIIKDEEGKELGKGMVAEDGTFEIETYKPLEPGKITATPETSINGEIKEGLVSDEKEVEFSPEIHKPEVNPVKEGDKKVTGKGQPGDEIVITDKDGKELGKGTVGEDGKFEVNLNRPLEKGETIKATPKTGDNEGEPVEKEVEFNPEHHKPEVDEDTVKEGSKEVTGTGVPGDEIVITDKDGKELGKGTVDEDGNFNITLNRPLKPGDELSLTPNTDGKEGTPVKLEPVEYDKGYHKPNIEKAIGGEEKVTGTGIPGDEIVITDEDGNELGTGSVDEEGNFKIEIDRPLKEGEKIKAQAVDGENKSEETEVEVSYNASNHKPTLNPAKEGDTKVTGIGIPGDEIIIKDKDGNELGRGKVDDNGKFEITVAPLMVGKLTAIPVTNGNEGEEGEGEVDYNPEAHKPNIEKAKEGEKEVTGKGVPGDEIVITDKDGNELGKGTVDKDGNFKIEIDRPLKEGEEVTAKAKTGDKESEDTKVTVTYEAEKHKPKLDPVEEGDKKLTGTGTPGDEIIVKDKDGNELGRGKVDKDGKFEINLDKPLKPGTIILTPVTGNNEGEALELEVKDKEVIIPEPEKPIDPEEPPFDKDKHKPEVEEIYDGDKIVSGKGIPGDSIIIVDQNGKELGKTQVDKNGNFKVELTRPVKEGEVIIVRPSTDGKEGTETLLTVKPKEEENVYDKLNSEDHIAYIQGFKDGTVRPEATVTREEVAAALYRLLKPSYRDTIKTSKTSFKDVGPKRWSRKHIATLENGNIINGTGYGKFSPARNITKAELVVMLSRLEKLDTRPNNDFTDIKGHWAEAEIKSAANKGWINGHGNNKFQPDKHLTRAEFVTMMNNVLNRKVEKKDILPEAKGFKDLKKDKWYYEAMMEAINSHHYERKDNGFEKWTDIYYPNLDM